MMPEELQAHHRIAPILAEAEEPAPVVAKTTRALGRAGQHLVSKPAPPKKVVSLWDGWEDAGPSAAPAADDEDTSDLDLDGLGL